MRSQLGSSRKDVSVKLVFKNAKRYFLRVRSAVVVINHHSAHFPLLLDIGTCAPLDGGKGDFENTDVPLFRDNVRGRGHLQVERGVREQLGGLLHENGRLAGELREVLDGSVHESLIARRNRRRLRLGDFQVHRGALERRGGAGHFEGTLREKKTVGEDALGEMEGRDVMHGVEELELHVGELGVEDSLCRSHRKNQRVILRFVGLAGHRVDYTGRKAEK